MKTQIEIELVPFQVPDYVNTVAKPRKRQDGIFGAGVAAAKSYRLDELSTETLKAMCEEFTQAILKKAGKL
jgi:hypothetical protein